MMALPGSRKGEVARLVPMFAQAVTQAVAAKPVAYLPEGRELVVGAYKQSLIIVTKAGEELYGVVRKGLGDVSAKLTGSTTVSGEVKKAKATVRKTAKKASATVKKVADAE